MSNSRLVASQCLSALALVLALITDFGVDSSIGVSPRITGISALILAIVAFAVALRTGSLVVSGFLSLQGLADVLSAATAGVKIGVIFGAIPLILGLVKLGTTLMSRKSRVEQQDRDAIERQRLTS
jgi:hypothetical protein